jgi:hypothetical protein
MRSDKAQDLAENLIPADQLGNRLRQVRRRQLPGIPSSRRAPRGSGGAAAIDAPESVFGLPYTVSISAVNW